MDVYKDSVDLSLLHEFSQLNADKFSNKIEKLAGKINQAHFTENCEDWSELRNYIFKINENYNKNGASIIFNEGTVENLLVAANDGLPNLDPFVTNSIIMSIEVLTEYYDETCFLLLRYDLYPRIVECLYNQTFSNVHPYILKIISNCILSTQSLMKKNTGPKTYDFDAINENFVHMYRILQEICFDLITDQCYAKIESQLFAALYDAITVCKFSLEEANEIYDKYILKIESYPADINDLLCPDLPAIIKSFAKFLQKEGSYYNNLISGRKFVPLIHLIRDTTIAYILTIFEPILKSKDVVDLLVENNLMEILCQETQVPKESSFIAFSTIASMIRVSDNAVTKLMEQRFIYRPQLYNTNETKQVKITIKIVSILLTKKVDFINDSLKNYISNLIEYCLNWDEYDTIESSLNSILCLMHAYSDFSLDIEDRLVEIHDNDDYEKLFPMVDEIMSTMFPEESD